jgi:hypothetical protein
MKTAVAATPGASLNPRVQIGKLGKQALCVQQPVCGLKRACRTRWRRWSRIPKDGATGTRHWCRTRENEQGQNLGRGRRNANQSEASERAADLAELKRKQEALSEKKNQETYKRLTAPVRKHSRLLERSGLRVLCAWY